MSHFIVICRVPAPPDIGNLAALIEVYALSEEPKESNGWTGRVVPLHEVDQNLAMAAITVLRVPVFRLGEILVVDESGREIGGAGRKPSKWDVAYEEFTSLDAAVLRSKQAEGVIEA